MEFLHLREALYGSLIANALNCIRISILKDFKDSAIKPRLTVYFRTSPLVTCNVIYETKLKKIFSKFTKILNQEH